MKHILRLVNYYKNTVTSTQPTFLLFDVSECRMSKGPADIRKHGFGMRRLLKQ